MDFPPLQAMMDEAEFISEARLSREGCVSSHGLILKVLKTASPFAF